MATTESPDDHPDEPTDDELDEDGNDPIDVAMLEKAKAEGRLDYDPEDLIPIDQMFRELGWCDDEDDRRADE